MKEEDKKKCDELWKELEQQIRSLCLAKLRYHPHEVDDIIAQAFLALCQRVDTDGFPDNPKAWIYGTCRNLIAKKYNEIYDKRRVCLDNIETELPFKEYLIATKVEEIYTQELKDKLHSFLSDREYQFVSYFYFQQLSVKEIASIFNSNESAVRQQIYRICNKLRKNIKDRDFFS